MSAVSLCFVCLLLRYGDGEWGQAETGQDWLDVNIACFFAIIGVMAGFGVFMNIHRSCEVLGARCEMGCDFECVLI